MMRLSNGNNTLAEVQKDFDDAAAFLGGNADQWLKKGHSNLIAINFVALKLPSFVNRFQPLHGQGNTYPQGMYYFRFDKGVLNTSISITHWTLFLIAVR